MGIDAGFDLSPPLEDEDKFIWRDFLWEVENYYSDDPVVILFPDRIEFQVGEYPTLDFDPTAFRRFSSKISGRSRAEPYLREVYNIAMDFFPRNRLFWWNEMWESFGPYRWKEVYEAKNEARDKKKYLFLGWKECPSHATFDDAYRTVHRAFEKTHIGMNGLSFEQASFPKNEGYTIVQQTSGGLLSQVESIEDWAKDPKDPNVKKAYWAARSNNNCETLNRVLLHVLKNSKKDILAVQTHRWNIIDSKTISLKKVGLTPKFVGTIVEPPCVSKVPSSDDGETFHLFLTCMTTDKQVLALDCSCAQFGVFSGYNEDKPFIAYDLVSYLKLLGKHRMLDPSGEGSLEVHPFVEFKVHSCLDELHI